MFRNLPNIQDGEVRKKTSILDTWQGLKYTFAMRSEMWSLFLCKNAVIFSYVSIFIRKLMRRQLKIFGYPCCSNPSLHKKGSFPLRISSVNVTKSLMENFIFCAMLSRTQALTFLTFGSKFGCSVNKFHGCIWSQSQIIELKLSLF